MKIDPLKPEFHNIPIWCVYGYDCFPQLICCRLSEGHGSINIWGFSIYKRSPGFRTIGLPVDDWRKKYDKCVFFSTQDSALEYLKKLTTPKGIK